MPVEIEALRRIPLFAQLNQQDLAQVAGMTREVIGRSLKELEAAGAIEMRQGRAVVLNRDRLRLLTSG